MQNTSKFYGSTSSMMSFYNMFPHRAYKNINIKKNNKNKENVKILVCAIAKLENKYIREWVEHYKNLGFDNVCLCDNNDENGEDFNDVIKDYIDDGFVILKNYRGKKAYQIMAYNECYNEMRTKYDWIAFFDIDEFLTIDNKKYNDIKDFITDKIFNDYNIIKIAWKNYSDNDLIRVVDNNYSIKRFNTEIVGDNQSKSIVHTSCDGCFKQNNPHCFKGKVKSCNAVGKTCPNTILLYGLLTFTNAHIKHYRLKTIEEFFEYKMKRLWPTNFEGGGKRTLTFDYFFQHGNKKTKEKLDFISKLKVEK